MRLQHFGLAAALVLPCFVFGCASPQQQTYAPAPPVSNAPMGMQTANAQTMPVSNNGAYHWRDVPAGDRVPVVRATFDQGGYQIYAQTGEIIAVPFENQNLNVLKFGRSQNGGMYFVNEQDVAPTLYLPNGAYLENAAAQGARWYPLPNDFAYTRPVYVSLAPSWNDWTGMGWYPGMTMYGGMWGYRPGISFAWMPSFYVNIGGSRYNSWGGYRSYYHSNPGYIRNRVVYRNYNTVRPTGRIGGFGTGRGTARSSSNFGSRSNGFSGFGRSSGSSGFGRSSGNSGFGSRPSSGFGSSGRTFGGGSGFGGSRSSSGFGSGFGSSRPSSGFGSSGSSAFGGRSGSGSFSGQRSSGSSFGSGRTSGGSFFGGSRSSGSGRSFGGSSSSGGSFRSGGSSFGNGRSSFGGGSSSFGGGRSSFGGSSGRRR